MESNIEQFKSITGVDTSIAQIYLSDTKGNLEEAIHKYFGEVATSDAHRAPPPTKNTSSPRTANSSSSNSKMEERFRACMVLSAVGDAIGYKEGKWEFNKNGMDILKQYYELGGITNITVEPKKWKVSDDTVMHIATAEALVSDTSNMENLYETIAKKYIISGRDMEGRAPGGATMQALMMLEGVVPYEGKKVKPKKWNEIPFDEKAGGCGASMRAMAIGLRFPGKSNRKQLISTAIESGRITHNNPVAFFGAVCSALFTAYALESLPVVEWGRSMLKELPSAVDYLKETKRDWDNYQRIEMDYFEKQWRKYLTLRKILDDSSKAPTWPKEYGPKERDIYYKEISFSGWGGSSGHDSVIIAYDALLAAKDSWEDLILRAALHGGDSDTTATIACAWWGAIYGFKDVPEVNYKNLEYRKKLEELAQHLFVLSGLA